MEKLRKIIRSVLKEIFQEPLNEINGIVPEIDELADTLSLDILSFIQNKYRLNRTINNLTTIKIPIDYSTKDKTLINSTLVNISFVDEGERNSVHKGNFNDKLTNPIVVNSKTLYDIEIDLTINWDFKSDILKKLSQVLVHELHHAFDYIVRIGKKNKSKIYNDIYNISKVTMQDFKEKNPALKEFLDCFYLSIPEETNARVQESANEIKHYQNETTDEILRNLYQTRAWRDAKKLMNYQTINIQKIPEEILKSFVIQFNNDKNLALLLKQFDVNKVNFPKEYKSFFNFWKRKFHHIGNDLFYRIIKSVSMTKKLKLEHQALIYINRDVLKETIGYDMWSGYCNCDNDFGENNHL